MMRHEVTNRSGLRFYLEKGQRGYFAGLIRGRHDMAGFWFPTEALALAAIRDGQWGDA